MTTYPEYISFLSVNREPTCTKQEFNIELGFKKEKGKYFYPKEAEIEKLFTSKEQSLRFGAAQFCGFLEDTVHVEHHVVIPAIRDLNLLPISIPEQPHLDLLKLATDEGHHAAQAFAFINAIKNEFDIVTYEKNKPLPLFVRELELVKSTYPSQEDKVLFNMLIGVVTETRISKELGTFIKDSNILTTVRDNCRSHQYDETIHCSQFMALGKYTWKMFNEEQRRLAASIYAKTTLARSMPDISRTAFYLSQVTGFSQEKCDEIINSIFTPKRLLAEVMLAATSTINFLNKLGVLEYKEAREVFEAAGIRLPSRSIRFDFNIEHDSSAVIC